MTQLQIVQEKLTQFIKRYYTNELIKGAILFFSIGLLYLIATLLIEHFLWLGQTGRSLLFWFFVTVALLLLFKFILIPLAYLFNLKNGIDTIQASKIIGNHFPEVDDKLLNLLQLQNEGTASELLLASIEQKAAKLSPIPFKLAVNFASNKKYLKYAAIPIIVILLFLATGNLNVFSDSYERVVNYQLAYELPAPFQFIIDNEQLKAIENTNFTLNVSTTGEIVPEDVSIYFNDQYYFLRQTGANTFQYVFDQPTKDIDFYISAGGFNSRNYNLQVIKTPNVTAFEMQLDYPAYTRKTDEVLKNTGNTVVPEGTNITWALHTTQTDQVHYYEQDTTLLFLKNESLFTLQKRLYNDTAYEITTSNDQLKDHERLGYSISVVKDAYPEMNLQSQKDSVDNRTLYFLGRVSDDYGLSKLRLVYYPTGNDSKKENFPLPLNKGTFDEFATTFPGDLPLKGGVDYEFYFEVVDNDGIRGGKSTKSQVFNYTMLTQEQLEEEQLQQQNQMIDDLNDSLQKMDQDQKTLEELNKTQKEKNQLNFNDKKKLEQFLQRQRQQEQMMKQFNKQMKENLEEFQKEEKDEFKEQLDKRLEQNEEELKKNEKLLEEIEKIAEKIKKEDLSPKLEELAKQQKNNKRSLQQILELTKRYYVAKKAEKLNQKINELAKKQEELSKKDGADNNKEEQDKINKAFEEALEEMKQLEEENNELRKPLKLPKDKRAEEEIKEAQKEASENLEKKEKSDNQQQKQQSQQKAQQKQKQAARKMKQMSQQMQQSMMGSGGEQQQEDAEMLRQILDNLVIFSFEQEGIMDQFKEIDNRNASFGQKLRRQNELRSLFEHVDDSLFALSLRQPAIGERVNKEIIDVYFNIDKALERLAENRMYQGVGSQQYALTSSNNLADLLSKILDNMQNQMSMGQGQGEQDQQLPDIIKSQQQLNEEMKKMMEEGKKEGEKKEGEQKKPGEEGEKQDGGPKKPGEGEKQGEGKMQRLNDGQPKEGEGQGQEMSSEQLYNIYKKQAQLRQQLEENLRKADEQLGDKKGKGSKAGDRLVRMMEQIEKELLEKGFTERTMQKMTQLQHELLKLENATFQQGQDNKRKSKTNQQQFNNNLKDQTNSIKQYFNATEILNRQVLPLRQIYQRKVQEYFRVKKKQ
ncbi:DUF4175 family protein [Spongiivirga sp. MCCC 1A20706]|uniref:DUF4175 family protein n=1 Tax=Spongiivirga sp. MCCC 1A20706 TaxID=3160963 RepID=UPI003977E334